MPFSPHLVWYFSPAIFTVTSSPIFAIPLISRGMLKSANSEDELAAIIAHEISHIQLEHSIKAIKKNTRTQKNCS